MSGRTHTPGPWTAFENGREDGSWSSWSITGWGPIAYGAESGAGNFSSKGNALLMAAAPELLQAVEDFVLLADLHDWEGAAIDNARAAINKARGGATC